MSDREIDSQGVLAQFPETAERMLNQMKIVGLDSRSDRRQEYDVWFNNCQRFCRKLASTVSEDETMARAKCLWFFHTHYIPTDTLVTTCVNGLVVASTLINMTDWQGSKLIIRTDGQTIMLGGALMASLSLRLASPITKQLQREREYISKHGVAAHRIFDKKSRARRAAEEVAVVIASLGSETVSGGVLQVAIIRLLQALVRSRGKNDPPSGTRAS
ncbi:MAG: hypothetical protein Q9159_005170 [Coniocarpon cinnabarinum]